ncbi:MAG: sugar phosphate isomerase/epimerase [Planctomycetes bacterium]|nr:sugar phosphate isomerase/epimerase [Planctomycetota bacterium]
MDHRITRRGVLGRLAGAAAAGLGAARILEGADEKRPRGRYSIGCYTRPWAEHEYRVAFDAVAEAGYRHVGLMTAKGKGGLVISLQTTLEEAAAIGEEARKRGLRIPSVYAGGIPIDKSIEAGIAGLRKLIDACAAARARNLMMGGVGDPKLEAPYYKAIAESCPYAAEKRIGISVKPHGGTNATGPQCRKLIEGVGRENFRLWYDPGNIFYYSDGKLDPVDDAATVDGLVVGVSVKDFLPPKNVSVTPGTGKVNFKAVFERLRKGGFVRGPLVVETLAPGDLPALLAEARKARVFLEALVAELR